MGCDIHLRAQRRSTASDPNLPDRWEDIPDNELGPAWPAAGSRNYLLFARLAGVRNYNLAEVPPDPESEWNLLWDKAPPLFQPLFRDRGLPPGEAPNAVYENNDESGKVLRGWLGDHSHTWATFEELLEADWRVPCRTVAYVRLDHYRAWRQVGARCPERWCSDVGGAVVTISAEELDRMDRGEGPMEELARNSTGVMRGGLCNTYVLAAWEWCPLVDCGFVRWLSSAAFARLCDRHGAENLRLLIGFDS